MLPTEPYLEQVARWPNAGRHILANADASSIVVYQAYRPAIAAYVLDHGVFGGPEFSFSRMSWIKPNFLWMMYRSAWATSPGQESVLGLRLSRRFFEQILGSAVPSNHAGESGDRREQWQNKLAASEVRLQWDPDHDPTGERLERRAIQLGLRGDALRAYATSELKEVIDMTPLIAKQRPHVRRESWHLLHTPIEHVYQPVDPSVGVAVGLDAGYRDQPGG
jgi:hypothetical protein